MNVPKRQILKIDLQDAASILSDLKNKAVDLYEETRKATGLNALTDIYSRFSKWNDYTSTMLENLFLDKSIIEEFTSIPIAIKYNDSSTFRSRFSLVIYKKHTKLESIFERLSLFEKAATEKINESIQQTKIPVENSWKQIESQFGISKNKFGRKINFISDELKRKIIFRDLEDAFELANGGYSKPAVILAGSVIEEMLRLYLIHRGFTPPSDRFDDYIKTCEKEGLLKSSISRLSDSVRQFRNLVHLNAEKTSKHTLSKATAIGAVSSIFTIANDF